MARVFVTRKIPEVGLEKLREAGHEVVVSEKDGVLSREELLLALSDGGYEAILSLLTDSIDAEVFAKAPEVKICANYAVGFNNIDVEAAKSAGVIVTNTPGVLSNTVAEYAFALIMAVTKRIPEADRFTRAGKYEGWAPELLLGSDLEGKTLGIVGAGAIGRMVAEKAQKGLGMKVIYSDIKDCEELEAAIDCTYVSLETVMAEADIISVHTPLLPATHHLINAEQIARMKPTSYLINTSRGPVVEEAALAVALKEGKIAGAGLDVFEEEPAVHPDLMELDNVVITPHIASASRETRDKMSLMAAENIIAVLSGGEPVNPVG